MASKARPDWINDRLYPFTDHWLVLDGHTIHYVDEGPRDAPVILFAHPGPAWSFMWRHHIRKLSTRFRCIAPDFPGFGLSTAAPGYGFSLGEQATSLEAFVSALDLQDVTLWANDGGGPTGVLAAARDPARYRALVVAGTFGWDLGPYKKVQRMLRVVSSAPFRFVNRNTNLMGRLLAGPAYGRRLPREDGLHYSRAVKGRARDRTLLLFGSFVRDTRTMAELEQALPTLRHLPCLIVFGDGDPAVKFGWHERWARAMPNHELHVLPGARHFTFEDAPEATTRLFERWPASGFEAQERPVQA